MSVDATLPSGVTLTSLTVDGDAIVPGASVSSQGVHTVVATGSNGDSSTTKFVIDSIAPFVSITSGPAQGSSTSATTANFAFTASEPAILECKLDGGPFVACQGGAVSYPGLGPGLHTFVVHATDVAENMREIVRTWTVAAATRSRIVFSRGGDIYSINIDGTGLTRVTSGLPEDLQPVLDPSGTLVVFSRNTVGGRQLFRVGAGGGTPVQLTTGPGDNMNPAFSPVGDRIAFDSARSGSKDRDIYTAPFSPGATSLNAVNLTNAAGYDLIPAWSRNGIVAFTSNRTGNFEIRKMPAAGGTATRLTNDRKRDIDPSFSPDGNTIAFASNRRAPEPGGAQESIRSPPTAPLRR